MTDLIKELIELVDRIKKEDSIIPLIVMNDLVNLEAIINLEKEDGIEDPPPFARRYPALHAYMHLGGRTNWTPDFSPTEMNRILGNVRMLKQEVEDKWPVYAEDLYKESPPTIREIMDATMTFLEEDNHVDDIMFQIEKWRKENA